MALRTEGIKKVNRILGFSYFICLFSLDTKNNLTLFNLIDIFLLPIKDQPSNDFEIEENSESISKTGEAEGASDAKKMKK